MSSAAVTARLREMSRLQEVRGFVVKGVDMKPEAIAERLRMWAALSELCRRLVGVGTLNSRVTDILGNDGIGIVRVEVK